MWFPESDAPKVLPMPFIYVAEFTDSHNVETEAAWM